MRRFVSVTLASALVALPIAPTGALAQSGLEAGIKQYNAATVRGYLQPLADVLVANLSGGYHNGARAPSTGFSFTFELAGSLATIDNELRTYTADLPPGFQPSTAETPTVFGGTAPTVNHAVFPGISWRGADGLINGDYFPTLVPQLRVGGVLGTELIARWVSSSVLPYLKDEDFPELNVFGIGVRHSLSQYLPAPAFDLAIGVSYNSLTFGDVIDLTSTSFSLQGGRDFGYLGLYGGIASDGGSMNVTYETTDPSETDGRVDTDIDAERSVRFTVGAALNIPIFKLFADATFGGVTTYSFGFRIGN